MSTVWAIIVGYVLAGIASALINQFVFGPTSPRHYPGTPPAPGTIGTALQVVPFWPLAVWHWVRAAPAPAAA